MTFELYCCATSATWFNILYSFKLFYAEVDSQSVRGLRQRRGVARRRNGRHEMSTRKREIVDNVVDVGVASGETWSRCLWLEKIEDCHCEKKGQRVGESECGSVRYGLRVSVWERVSLSGMVSEMECMFVWKWVGCLFMSKSEWDGVCDREWKAVLKTDNVVKYDEFHVWVSAQMHV